MAQQYNAKFLRYFVEAFHRVDISPSAHQLVGLLEDMENYGYRIVDTNGEANPAHDDPMFAEVQPAPPPPPARTDALFCSQLHVVIMDDAGAFRTEPLDLSKLHRWRDLPLRTDTSALVDAYTHDEAAHAFMQWRAGDGTYDVERKTDGCVTFYYLSNQIHF